MTSYHLTEADFHNLTTTPARRPGMVGPARTYSPQGMTDLAVAVLAETGDNIPVIQVGAPDDLNYNPTFRVLVLVYTPSPRVIVRLDAYEDRAVAKRQAGKILKGYPEGSRALLLLRFSAGGW
jgi:hypothetical protein